MSQAPPSDDDSSSDDSGSGSDSGSSAAYKKQVKQSAAKATKELQGGWLEYATRSKDARTQMSIGGVALPGAYKITESAGGYTAKYVAEKSEARAAATNYSGPDAPYDAERPPGAFRAGTVLNSSGDPIQTKDGSYVYLADPGPSITTGSSSSDSTLLVVDKGGDPFKDQDGNDLTVTKGEAQLADGTGNPVTVSGPVSSPPEPQSSQSSDSSSDDGTNSSGGSSGSQSSDEATTGGSSGGGSTAGDLPPPPKQVTIQAFCTDQTYRKLDSLRESRKPLALGIGEFTIDDCGITTLQRDVDILGINKITIDVKQHRQVVVQAMSGPRGYRQDSSASPNGNKEAPTTYEDKVKDLDTKSVEGSDTRVYTATKHHQEIPLNDGEELSGLLIDQREPNAGVTINATGANWKIKNIGFKGHTAGEPSQTGKSDPTSIVNLNVSASEKGVIENVYLGDGAKKYDNGVGYVGGVTVRPDHSGSLSVKNVNIQGIPHLAFRAANVDGTVTVADSFFANNDRAGLWLGSKDSTATNCVILVESDAGGMPHSRLGAKRRGAWAVNADITFEKCDIAQRDGTAPAVLGNNDGKAILKDCSVDGPLKGTVVKKGTFDKSPDLSVPDGVPTSAVDAATSGSSSSSS